MCIHLWVVSKGLSEPPSASYNIQGAITYAEMRQQLRSNEETIQKTEVEIEQVNVRLGALDAEIRTAKDKGDKEEVKELRQDKKRLEKEKEQLRKKEEQLRKKEKMMLMERMQGEKQPVAGRLSPLEGSLLFTSTTTSRRLQKNERSRRHTLALLFRSSWSTCT